MKGKADKVKCITEKECPLKDQKGYCTEWLTQCCYAESEEAERRVHDPAINKS